MTIKRPPTLTASDQAVEVSFVVHEMNYAVQNPASVPCYDISGEPEEVVASMERALTEEGYVHERLAGKLLILGQIEKPKPFLRSFPDWPPHEPRDKNDDGEEDD